MRPVQSDLFSCPPFQSRLSPGSQSTRGCVLQGQPGQLAAAAPALLECDLTGNLLPDWAAVVAVLRELPHLRVLNLTASRLTQPSAGLAAHGSFSALRTLVLNRCCIQRWDEVRVLAVCRPHLSQVLLGGYAAAALCVFNM